MAVRSFTQRRFTRGKIDPFMYGHKNLEGFGETLKEARNVDILPTGFLQKRTGVEKIFHEDVSFVEGTTNLGEYYEGLNDVSSTQFLNFTAAEHTEHTTWVQDTTYFKNSLVYKDSLISPVIRREMVAANGFNESHLRGDFLFQTSTEELPSEKRLQGNFPPCFIFWRFTGTQLIYGVCFFKQAGFDRASLTALGAADFELQFNISSWNAVGESGITSTITEIGDDDETVAGLTFRGGVWKGATIFTNILSRTTAGIGSELDPSQSSFRPQHFGSGFNHWKTVTKNYYVGRVAPYASETRGDYDRVEVRYKVTPQEYILLPLAEGRQDLRFLLSKIEERRSGLSDNVHYQIEGVGSGLDVGQLYNSLPWGAYGNLALRGLGPQFDTLANFKGGGGFLGPNISLTGIAAGDYSFGVLNRVDVSAAGITTSIFGNLSFKTFSELPYTAKYFNFAEVEGLGVYGIFNQNVFDGRTNPIAPIFFLPNTSGRVYGPSSVNSFQRMENWPAIVRDGNQIYRETSVVYPGGGRDMKLDPNSNLLSQIEVLSRVFNVEITSNGRLKILKDALATLWFEDLTLSDTGRVTGRRTLQGRLLAKADIFLDSLSVGNARFVFTVERDGELGVGRDNFNTFHTNLVAISRYFRSRDKFPSGVSFKLFSYRRQGISWRQFRLHLPFRLKVFQNF